MARCLSFDYGLGSTGVAVGDIDSLIVEPLDALKMDRGEPDWLLVEQLVLEWSPVVLLVGKPLREDGKQQALTTKAHLFAKQLRSRFNISVKEVDERYSTVEARSKIFDEFGVKGLLKSKVDSQSAVIICKQWLGI